MRRISRLDARGSPMALRAFAWRTRRRKLHGDRLADRAAQQIFHRGDELVDVERPRVEWLAAREGEQPVRHRGRAVRRVDGRLDIAPDLADAALADARLQHFQRAENP